MHQFFPFITSSEFFPRGGQVEKGPRSPPLPPVLTANTAFSVTLYSTAGCSTRVRPSAPLSRPHRRLLVVAEPATLLPSSSSPPPPPPSSEISGRLGVQGGVLRHPRRVSRRGRLRRGVRGQGPRVRDGVFFFLCCSCGCIRWRSQRERRALMKSDQIISDQIGRIGSFVCREEL